MSGDKLGFKFFRSFSVKFEKQWKVGRSETFWCKMREKKIAGQSHARA
jgi:hypothetical protein